MIVHKLDINFNKCVVNNFKMKIHTFINGPQTIEYWKERWWVSDEQLMTIDWDSLEWAYKEVDLKRQWWAMKFCPGQFGHEKT